MKLHRLHIKNIHSLAGEHSVDFTSGLLGEAGLFAITGPTGSGKSTLLDAITLALYNRISRSSGPISEAQLDGDGLVITHHTDSCFSEVLFSVGDRSYRASWSIERNRNGIFRERKHEISEVESGKILASGRREAPECIAKIIGLSYEQFSQAMVLSQGKFDKLLKSKPEERYKLLEDLVGGQRYRQIGKKTYERYKSVQANLHELELQQDALNILSDESLANLKKEVADLGARIKTREKQRNEQDQLHQKLVVWNEAQGALKKVAEQGREWEKKMQNFQPQLERLRQHEVWIPKYHHVKRGMAATDALQKAADQLKSNGNRLEQVGIRMGELLQASRETWRFPGRLPRGGTPDGNFLKAFKQHHNELASEVAGWMNEEQQLLTVCKGEVKQFQSILDRMSELESRWRLEFNAQSGLALDQIREELEAERAGLATNEETLEELEHRKKQLDLAVVSAKHRQRLEKSAEQRKKRIDQLEDALEKEAHQTEQLKESLEELEEAYKRAKEKYDRYVLETGLAARRGELRHEEPCPLCGSHHHPYTEHPPEKLDEEAFRAMEALEVTVAERKKQLQEMEVAQSQKVAERNAEVTAYREMLDDVQEQVEALKNLTDATDLEAIEAECASVDELLKARVRREQIQSLLRAVKELKGVFEAYESTREKHRKLRAKREEVYKGNDVHHAVRVHLEAWDELVNEHHELVRECEELKRLMEESAATIQEVEQSLDAAVKEAGLDHWKSIGSLILEEVEAAEFRDLEATLTAEKTRLEQRKSDLQAQVKAGTEEGLDGHDADRVKAKLDEIVKLWEQELSQRAAMAQQIATDAEQRARRAAFQEEWERMQKEVDKWKLMNDLIGSATGKTFAEFVQEITLKQLLGLANRRLQQGLSDRFVLEMDGSGALYVRDAHLGMSKRIIHTLSGGETFKMSLAMAMGLSDLAARRVNIESLFVDEGFGSLDPESLEEAMEVLERMQQDGDKSIGVISHVSEMKERISTKIQLVPVGNGLSTLQVIAE